MLFKMSIYYPLIKSKFHLWRQHHNYVGVVVVDHSPKIKASVGIERILRQDVGIEIAFDNRRINVGVVVADHRRQNHPIHTVGHGVGVAIAALVLLLLRPIHRARLLQRNR